VFRERRKRWNFFIGDDGSWLWRVLDPDECEAFSERSFRSLKDCIADAKQHGYVVWRSEERRLAS
jgi:hypothetical protein